MLVVEEKHGAMVSLKFIKSTTLCDIIKLCHLNVLFRDISIIFIALFVCHGNGPDTMTSDSALLLHQEPTSQPTDSIYMRGWNGSRLQLKLPVPNECVYVCRHSGRARKQILAGRETRILQIHSE